ncbi:MAG TPA: DUF3300 domain-containing protein [Opitutaceae bacterium]|nr:DUF3300 domain-containing protein [Opitutaceae bacterium]
MKPLLTLILLGVSVAAPLRAQTPVAIQYGPGSLEQLVAPIALYPDSLVALLLPAAGVSGDVVLAARYLEQGGDLALADAQPWDPSVQALAHYPDLITWMAGNLTWTQALGQAYALQPAAVMQAVQTLRARALAAGSLVSTPQQQVIVAGGVIEIVPAQASLIYVPCYDWTTVYDVGPAWDYPLVTFRVGYAVGPWLDFACDWREHRIRPGVWNRGWNDRRDFGGRRDFAGDRGRDSHRDFNGPRERDPRRDFRPPAVDRRDTRSPTLAHVSPPSANHGSPFPPRVDGTPGPRAPRAPTVQSPPSRHPVVNAPPARDRGPDNRRWVAPNPGPRHEAVRATPRPPASNRGPAAGYVQTAPPRNPSGRSQGSRPAIQNAPRAPSHNAVASTPAPRATRGRSNDRPFQVAER